GVSLFRAESFALDENKNLARAHKAKRGGRRAATVYASDRVALAARADLQQTKSARRNDRVGGAVHQRARPADSRESFWRARRHERRAAQTCFRRAQKLERVLPDDRSRRFERRARSAIPFREPGHSPGGRARPEIFLSLHSFTWR